MKRKNISRPKMSKLTSDIKLWGRNFKPEVSLSPLFILIVCCLLYAQQICCLNVHRFPICATSLHYNQTVVCKRACLSCIELLTLCRKDHDAGDLKMCQRLVWFLCRMFICPLHFHSWKCYLWRPTCTIEPSSANWCKRLLLN